MRIITGSARGVRLRTLEGNDVRPTAERVKEAVFSIIQFDIEGRRVLDLFAGCGQLGIEALSRGAESAVFTDTSAAAVKVIKENLRASKLEDRAEVYSRDFRSFLDTTEQQFDIAFLDPPYHMGLYSDALQKTAKHMSDYGIIICEHPSDVSVPRTAGEFVAVKDYRYGKVLITTYRKGDEHK